MDGLRSQRPCVKPIDHLFVHPPPPQPRQIDNSPVWAHNWRMSTPSAPNVYRANLQKRWAAEREAAETRRTAAYSAVVAAIPATAVPCASIQRVYLYGSIMREGAFHEESDIDVGVQGSTAEDYSAFWRELQRALPDWFVDVRELNDDAGFAEIVRLTGELVYER